MACVHWCLFLISAHSLEKPLARKTDLSASGCSFSTWLSSFFVCTPSTIRNETACPRLANSATLLKRRCKTCMTKAKKETLGYNELTPFFLSIKRSYFDWESQLLNLLIRGYFISLGCTFENFTWKNKRRPASKRTWVFWWCAPTEGENKNR